MLPTALLLTVAATREGIPFPSVVEALMMELMFEALREAGVRLPRNVGQAVSIVGALVIGQAAVQAGLVSAPMVIIVAITGIASFSFPRFNLGVSVRLLRFPMVLLASTLGPLRHRHRASRHLDPCRGAALFRRPLYLAGGALSGPRLR